MTDPAQIERLRQRLAEAEAKARRTKAAAKGLMNLARVTVRDLAQLADELAEITHALDTATTPTAEEAQHHGTQERHLAVR